jgi:hypothetical protein
MHPLLKVLLGRFIVWSALGVGELFDKIELMRRGLFHQGLAELQRAKPNAQTFSATP